VDELNLTVAATVVGGGPSPRIVAGADRADEGRGSPTLIDLDLDQVCEDEGYLFLRYLRRR
jgi:hypothetical protein